MTRDRAVLWRVGLIFAGGLLVGLGLEVSQMARPEVVLDFLQFEDFGLLLVMGTAALLTGSVVFGATNWLDEAPLTGQDYQRGEKDLDRRVIIGGSIFGIGWGLSGICPGAAYASFGIGNFQILWGVAGMFLGSYIQGL